MQLGGSGTNTISPNPADTIYLGCASCSLTFQGPNASDDGIGRLKLLPTGEAQFDVAQPGATMNVTADIAIRGSLTKVGSGTLNFSNNTLTAPASPFFTLRVNEGIMNLLPGVIFGVPRVTLDVNNPNTAAGTAVTLNLHQSYTIQALTGTIAVPSSGANTATVNLVGAGTNLAFLLRDTNSYAGAIAGEGSVSLFQQFGIPRHADVRRE